MGYISTCSTYWGKGEQDHSNHKEQKCGETNGRYDSILSKSVI